jgi:hypothetical protein
MIVQTKLQLFALTAIVNGVIALTLLHPLRAEASACPTKYVCDPLCRSDTQAERNMECAQLGCTLASATCAEPGGLMCEGEVWATLCAYE